MSQIYRHFVFVLFALIVNPLIGWSHPGHASTASGVDQWGPAHYLIEPVHVIPVVAVIAIGLTVLVTLGAGRHRKNAARSPVRP